MYENTPTKRATKRSNDTVGQKERFRSGQSFFLPLFGEVGTSYTDGTRPDAFLDLSILKTLVIKFTIYGKTIVDRRNVMDFYSQFAFVPPVPFNSGWCAVTSQQG